MKRAIFSSLGILLVTISVAGMAISLFGIVGLWQLEANLQTSLQETLSLLSNALQTTADGLAIASQSLDQADSALVSLSAAVEAAGDSVEKTLPLIDTLSTVTTQELPQTISKSQQAIQSAQSSARIIDSTLATLASIPLIGLRGYDRTRPLSGSLAELSKSLDPIATSLRSMEESLTTSKDSLSAIGASTAEIASDITNIRNSLAQAKQVTTQYIQIVADLRQKVNTTQESLPAALNRLSGFFTIVLLWLGLTQIGLLLQGLELLGLKLGNPQQATSEAGQR